MLTIWSTWRQEGWWATSPRQELHRPSHVTETVLPSAQLLSTPAPVLEHSSHAETDPYSHNRLSWMKPTCLSETPKESGERRVSIHNRTVLGALPGSSPPWPAVGTITFDFLLHKNTQSHHRWHKWKPWPYHPKMPCLCSWYIRKYTQSYVFSPPAFSFMYHRWRKPNGSLILFPAPTITVMYAPPFSFLRKGTEKSAQISKANVIKQ